jgi:hypothetical protein
VTTSLAPIANYAAAPCVLLLLDSVRTEHLRKRRKQLRKTKMRTFLIHKQKPFQTMKTQIEEIPTTHLSKNSEGWSLMHNGMPLCAVTTQEKAEGFAEHFKLKLPHVFWDGEQGQFVSI